MGRIKYAITTESKRIPIINERTYNNIFVKLKLSKKYSINIKRQNRNNINSVKYVYDIILKEVGIF